MTPSAAGETVETGKSLATTPSAGGGGGGDAHKPYKYLISSAGSELSLHLCYVDTNRAYTMEDLLALLYNRVKSRVYR